MKKNKIVSLGKILWDSQLTEKRIADLKKKSSYYPQVLIEECITNLCFRNNKYEKTIYASTLVRIERDGIWYTVHCVESIILTENTSEKDLLIKFMDSVYKIQHLYKVTGYLEDVDSIQKSEFDRLMELINKVKN